MSEVLKKFGRYFLLDRIAQGGMAEIYRARFAATDGVGRLLVVKRIQQGYGANAEFVSMFESETRVSMGFNHPNVVSVYDYGKEQNQPYISMELVDGKNLRQFLQRFAELKQGFPIDLAAYIIEQAAAGLQYAHAYKDKISGDPLHIVHRDISPQNILISYEGNVKVIDFGIAKAATNSESTRAGIIKGKPSYLAPEQISGVELDGRCDIFALGTVLWELLVGKKLFSGDNDLAVLKQIEACGTSVKPPSSQNPEIPKELDYIVLKSLAKQREMRYQTAEEFRRALHKFVYGFNPDFNPADLSYYAKDLFKTEIVEDRKRIQKLNEKAEQLLRSGQETSESDDDESENSGSGKKKKEDTTTVFEVRDAEKSQPQQVKSGGPKDFPRNKVQMEKSPQGRRSTMPSADPRQVMQGTGSIQVSSRSIQVQTERESSGGVTYILIAAALAGVVYIGPQFGIRIPVISAMIEGDKTTRQLGEVTLQGNDKNVEVLVDNKVVASELPATLRDFPVGVPVSIVIKGSSGNFRSVVSLTPGESKSITVVLSGTPSDFVTDSTGKVLHTINLRLKMQPPLDSQTVVSLGGKAVPINNGLIQVPLDQSLEVSVEKPGYKPFRREFVLDSRQASGLREYPMDVNLEPVRFGYLSIRTTPSADAFLVLRDGARSPSSEKPLVRRTPLESEKVAVGTYQVRLVNEVLGMEKTVTISVQEGKSINIDERLEVKN